MILADVVVESVAASGVAMLAFKFHRSSATLKCSNGTLEQASSLEEIVCQDKKSVIKMVSVID
jgi:hypothetical protein